MKPIPVTERIESDTLGIGAGFRPVHYAQVVSSRPRDVDFFEIVTENFLAVGGRPRRYLEKLRAAYPVSMHGVSLSIGSTDPLDEGYLRHLAALVREIEPFMVSDHLCWSRHRGESTHDLLPLAYTREALDRIVQRLDQIQNLLGCRFYLENPSAYAGFAAADFDEPGFLRELVRRSGAGVLLDVNNLYVCQRNLGLDPDAYLAALAPGDIGCMHLAGHLDRGDVLIDTHDGPVCDAVWSLFERAVRRFPRAPVLIEWDDKVPELPVLMAECRKAAARRAQALAQPDAGPTADAPSGARRPAGGVKVPPDAVLHGRFYGEIRSADGISLPVDTSVFDGGLPVPAATGLEVYNQAYFLRLHEVLVATFPTLSRVCGDEGFKRLAAAYLTSEPPRSYSVDHVGQCLAGWLRDGATRIDWDYGASLELLGDIAALEWAKNEVYVAPDPRTRVVDATDLASTPVDGWETLVLDFVGSMRTVEVAHAVGPVLAQVAAGEDPDLPDSWRGCYLVTRADDVPEVRRLPAAEALLLKALREGVPFGAACRLTAAELGQDDGDLAATAAAALAGWCQAGLLASLSHTQPRS